MDLREIDEVVAKIANWRWHWTQMAFIEEAKSSSNTYREINSELASVDVTPRYPLYACLEGNAIVVYQVVLFSFDDVEELSETAWLEKYNEFKGYFEYTTSVLSSFIKAPRNDSVPTSDGFDNDEGGILTSQWNVENARLVVSLQNDDSQSPFVLSILAYPPVY